MTQQQNHVIKDMPFLADHRCLSRPEGDGYIVGYDGNGTYDSEEP